MISHASRRNSEQALGRKTYSDLLKFIFSQLKNKIAQQLKLLQLTDSALPVGASAHSFGLESLVEDGFLTVDKLEFFLRDYLFEAGMQEGVFCRVSCRIGAGLEKDRSRPITDWLELNRNLGARKPARESRAASATLGRRFLQLAFEMTGHPQLGEVAKSAKQSNVEIHHCAAFGLTAGLLEIDEKSVVPAFIQQTITGLISVCQRLLPLGQTQAQKILWNLKPTIAEISLQTDTSFDCDDVYCFTPLLDIGAMRHSSMSTRLFIS